MRFSYTHSIRLTILIALFSSQILAQNVNTTFRSKLTYPGQTLANIWGYVADGREYALVGGSKFFIIVDITNPDAPQQITQIAGPDNLWKEIKTYQHYAYIVSEGGQGIQIVNLSNLPASNLPSKFYKGNGAIQNQLDRIHALHIDETKGFLYAWGGNLFDGGAKIFDLKQDPWNPNYVGKFDQLGYIHDGYVDNDTMYSCHIYAGQFAIVNAANKANPELINTQTTPGAFTHNTWITDDRRTILATDEVNNSYLSAWDVSDPTDIKFLDQIQSNPGSNSMVHNTYVRGNWAITSWYKDGFTIVDITRPDNLVQVGNYDTYPGTGGGSQGCWGVYHNFPSGNIIASNISVNNAGELWVITPNYVRACYLEGRVRDAITGLNVFNAQVQVLGAIPAMQENTNLMGVFKMGREAEGHFIVRVSKSGYQPFETTVYFQRGEVLNLDVKLFPNGLHQVGGTVISKKNGQPLENASVWLYGSQNFGPANTDATGHFNFDNVPQGIYDIMGSSANLSQGGLVGQTIVSDTTILLELSPLFRREGVGAREDGLQPILTVFQNPFHATTLLNYQTPAERTTLLLLNNLGQTVQRFELQGQTGQITIGVGLPAGTYHAVLRSDGIVQETLKLVKN